MMKRMFSPLEKERSLYYAAANEVGTESLPPSDIALANAIRVLAADMIEKANSGHPGAPLGLAEVATVLYRYFIKHDPQHTNWPNRDRFILSAGHASALLYALFYLMQYPDMTVEELKNFRQLNSRTPGHPEYRHTTGVETTTGPLGQGLANAVGLALAERKQQARYPDIINHFTYALVGDGCLMEGISQEAISLAGHQKLSRLIVLWDDNSVTIDGYTDISTADNQIDRFKASNWHTQSIDGHNPQEIIAAITAAQQDNRPSFIACKTTIGFGAPTKAGLYSMHSGTLGAEELAQMKVNFGYNPEEHFVVPQPILEAWAAIGAQNHDLVQTWNHAFRALGYEGGHIQQLLGELPESLDGDLETLASKFASEQPCLATRTSSQKTLELLTEKHPHLLLGGSADLSPSNGTHTAFHEDSTPEHPQGNYLRYGVREHAMGSIMNGLALHNIRPYGGTFLVFADYVKPAIRLSALMNIPVIYIFTHDSLAVGEDGPTHQPIEQLASLRATPELYVIRPCDAVEVAEAWRTILHMQESPAALILSRQNLPTVRQASSSDVLLAYGGYTLAPQSESLDSSESTPAVTLIASGAEVQLALEVKALLEEKHSLPTSVVSMPCWELFEEQPESHKEKVLPKDSIKISIEAGSTQGWCKWTGANGLAIGIDHFGASAPGAQVLEHFGFEATKITQRILDHLTNLASS